MDHLLIMEDELEQMDFSSIDIPPFDSDIEDDLAVLREIDSCEDRAASTCARNEKAQHGVQKTVDQPLRREMREWLKQFNPEQKRVILGRKPACVVLAGPGSGKTRTIVGRIKFLLRFQRVSSVRQCNVAPQKILGLTFTNKAAREMCERVAGAVTEDSDNTATMGSTRGGYRRSPLICTYHGLCARLLRQYGHHVGLDPSFVICNDTHKVLKTIKKELDHNKRSASKQNFAKEEIDLSPKALAAKVSHAKRVRFARYSLDKFNFPQVRLRNQAAWDDIASWCG